MIEFLTSLIDFAARDQASVKIAVTLLILVFGYLGVKIARAASRKVLLNTQESLTKKEVENRQEAIKYSGYFLEAGVISLGLVYLNTSVTQTFTTKVVNFLPQALSAALVALLGIIAIELATKLGENFLKTVGIPKYFRDAGLSRSTVDILSWILKGFMYVILLQITLSQLGIGDTFVREFINASSWAVSFLAAGLLFYGFRHLFENFSAGIYLKNSRLVRPGEEVEIDGEKAKINEISLFSTNLDTMSGNTILTPNREIMDSNIAFRRTESDLDTLEEIQSYFVAEKPEKTGQASLELAMEMLDVHINSENIENITLSSPKETVEAVEELSDEKVKAAFIESEKTTDVSSEFKTWFNDGGLVIPAFNKKEIFSGEIEDSYALSVGVENEEILIVDPDSEHGGVYFVDAEKLEKAIERHETPGYFVLAPEDTTAYWRIKKELLYSQKNHYDEISKTLESRLTKIMRKGRILDEIMSPSAEQYMEKWRSKGDITALWSSKEE